MESKYGDKVRVIRDVILHVKAIMYMKTPDLIKWPSRTNPKQLSHLFAIRYEQKWPFFGDYSNENHVDSYANNSHKMHKTS